MTAHRNAAAGETLVVHPVTAGVLRAELAVEPVHHAPPPHVHPRAAERFTVVSGAIRVRIGRERLLLEEGGSALVPAGVVHGYEGVPGVAARVLVELDPAGRMAQFFADVYAIDAAERHPRTGAPRLRAAARVLRRYPDDIAVPGVPRLLLAVLGR